MEKVICAICVIWRNLKLVTTIFYVCSLKKVMFVLFPDCLLKQTDIDRLLAYNDNWLFSLVRLFMLTVLQQYNYWGCKLRLLWRYNIVQFHICGNFPTCLDVGLKKLQQEITVGPWAIRLLKNIQLTNATGRLAVFMSCRFDWLWTTIVGFQLNSKYLFLIYSILVKVFAHPFKKITIRCSNNFHCRRYMKSST